MGGEDRFEIVEATPSDMDDIINIVLLAVGDDECFKCMYHDVPFYAQFRLMYEFMGFRYNQADVQCYLMKETATGKTVGYNGLLFPWSIRPVSDEVKAQVTSTDPLDMPLAPKGLRMEGWIGFVNMLTACHKWHDPMKDFHRFGTMILPEYQRLGLGERLTQHVNKVVDQHGGGKTYVACRYTSVEIFKRNGFKPFAVYDPQVERWGPEYDAEKAKFTLLVRESVGI